MYVGEYAVRRLAEIRRGLKPRYVYDLEKQANRFVSGLTIGAEEEKLFETEGRELLIYHHGPEKRVVPGFPSSEKPTGREYVFLQYHCDKNFYHLEGNVDASKKFTLLRLNRYNKNGYRRVLMYKHKEVICTVTKILQEMEPAGSVDA